MPFLTPVVVLQVVRLLHLNYCLHVIDWILQQNQLETKMSVDGWLSSIWMVNVHIHVNLYPKHCANKIAEEWQEEIVFQCPVVCGPFTSHFCTEPAFCSTSVSAFPK